MQRPDAVAGADRLVRGLGGEPGLVGIDFNKGVKPGIERRDAPQQGFDDSHRRQTSRADLRGKNMGL